MEVRVDGAGRMVIPARLRRLLGIGDDGGVVEVEDTGDGLMLRPPDRERPEIRPDGHGLLVIDIGRDVSTDEVRDAIDDDRGHRG